MNEVFICGTEWEKEVLVEGEWCIDWCVDFEEEYEWNFSWNLAHLDEDFPELLMLEMWWAVDDDFGVDLAEDVVDEWVNGVLGSL